jgi:hypothetical protein
LIRQDQSVFESLLMADGSHGRRFDGVGSREVRVYVYDKKAVICWSVKAVMQAAHVFGRLN